MNLYIGNLDYGLEESELQELFEEHGEVSSAKIITDKFTGRSKGFGFVEMADDASGQAAIDALDGTAVNNRNIKVAEAKERSDRRDDRRNGNRY